MADLNKLDNPVWYSLCETHRPFAIDYGNIKFYDPAYCPFGGFTDNENTTNPVDAYANLLDNFYIIGEKPVLSDHLQITREVSCLQMLIDTPIASAHQEEIIELGSRHADALYELVNLVQPGYIKRKTPLMGTYFGIFTGDQLVAVAGERMKMVGFTEISAVCTLPGHTGKGFASHLLAHTAAKIFAEQKIPYLHVAESNMGAVKLYEKLGFKTRRKISAWNIAKKLQQVPGC